MVVRFKKLHPLAKVPIFATDGACACDLYAAGFALDDKTQTWIYDSGIAFEIPDGYAGFVLARSSLYKCCNVLPASGFGLVDADFRGSVKFTFRTFDFSKKPPYAIGERFAQLLIIAHPQIELIESEELTETKRGAGGFGSTGK